MKDVHQSSNRQFGLLFFFVFFLIALYPMLNNESLRVWSLIISLVFLILGIINSNLLFPFNKAWSQLGILLGKIVSPVIMCFIFFTIITQIGFIMRMLKKDLLNLKFNKEKSYWVEKNDLKSKMKNQF